MEAIGYGLGNLNLSEYYLHAFYTVWRVQTKNPTLVKSCWEANKVAVIYLMQLLNQFLKVQEVRAGLYSELQRC